MSCSSVKTLLLNYENEADRITELAEAGPEWGVKAALALAYFHGNSMEEGKEAAYHLKCIRTELLSLERTALSAELMFRNAGTSEAIESSSRLAPYVFTTLSKED